MILQYMSEWKLFSFCDDWNDFCDGTQKHRPLQIFKIAKNCNDLDLKYSETTLMMLHYIIGRVNFHEFSKFQDPV